MISRAIEDSELKEHITSLPPDGREVFLIADDTVRLSVVSATTMVNQMRANHRTGLLETYVLGQGYIAGALLSSAVKGNDRIQLGIECGGPVKGMYIEAWASGAVRGYLMNNPIPLEKPLESFDTSELYGPGFLTVTRILEGSRTPVSGQIMLQYGNLAADLEEYFQESEQTRTLFYTSIEFDRQGRVQGAGGIFLQALPGCSDETFGSLREKMKGIGGMGKSLAGGMTAAAYAASEFASYDPEHIGHTPIGFSCPCSKEHFSSYLRSLPDAEKSAMLEGAFPLVLTCVNCGSEYSYTEEETKELFRGSI